MTIPLLDREGLAQACIDGDLAPFAATAQLGWTLTPAARDALVHAVATTNYHKWFSYGVSAFRLAAAIGLIAEAAHNQSGIAITEQIRKIRLGKEIAIAFRHAGHIYFGVRYASNLPMNPGVVWPELKPWYKDLERNRTRLEQWISCEDVVAIPLIATLASDQSERPSGAELLAAVIAEPDAVEHRLVYADWLVGLGDAQGELIQLCERRRSLGRADLELDARIEQLEREYGERIAGDVAQLASKYQVHRGFVTQIEMPAPSFAKHGERLLASHPIDELELKPVNAKALARLARAPAVRKLRALRISQLIGNTRPMPFADLCRSSLFEALQRLGIWTWVTDGDPIDDFAQWSAPRLASMVLYEVDSAAQIIAGLARNEVIRLRSLHVRLRQRVSWESPFASPAFAQLRDLRLSTGGPGFHDVLASASLPALEHLELEDTVPIEHLNLPSLRRLRLEGPVSARSFAELLEGLPRLEGLHIRNVDADEIDDIVAHALTIEHPLQALWLPDQAAQDRLKQRFARSFDELGRSLGLEARAGASRGSESRARP